MFLPSDSLAVNGGSLLRTSGDVSMEVSIFPRLVMFAPHERRCFSIKAFIDMRKAVCSARAEMFLHLQRRDY